MAGLGHLKDALLRGDVLAGDLELGLKGAQGDIGIGNLGCQRHLHGGIVHAAHINPGLGLSLFLLDAAKHINLPAHRHPEVPVAHVVCLGVGIGEVSA